jgi:S-adenosylmethionine synthetase
MKNPATQAGSMRSDFLFTSESVTEGHPDKLCDQIADAIVDSFLHQDHLSRVAAECAVAGDVLFISSRFRSRGNVDIPEVARGIIEYAGYDREDFNSKHCTVITSFTEVADQQDMIDEENLSEEEIEKVSAKDNANVFGFACTQTHAMIPITLWLAHKLAKRLSSVRRNRTLPYLVPDGKTQVGVEFRKRKPHRIHSVTLVAGQYEHDRPLLSTFRDDLYDHIIEPVFADESIKPDDKTRIFINPEGEFVTGGPSLHSGLTGRKNAIDTYGEYSRHSGAALSGKDPTRVDRIGVYAARYAAKNIVAAKLAEECEVQLSYSMGLARPVSIQVETFGTGQIPDEQIARRLESTFDFRPAGIVRQFGLRRLSEQSKDGFYRRLAAYGHVGRPDLNLPWENTANNPLKS